jgi:hypothetical protein
MVGGWRAGPEGGRLPETGGEEAGGSEDNLSQRRCRRTCDRRRGGGGVERAINHGVG